MAQKSGVRLVKVLNKQGRTLAGIIISDTAAGQGTELIHVEVDSQSNKVNWVKSSRARYGKDYVEIDEKFDHEL